MKVWWVIGWDDYYPGVDNFRSSFASKEEAEEWIKEEIEKNRSHVECDHYEVINISNRL